MSIELVGLAFDEKVTDQVWQEMRIQDAYSMFLEDDFRRRVDPRSLLYHKGTIDILTELEQFLKQGGRGQTLVELLAARFRGGVEDFPSASGELSFDFKLIRQFSSLAMVDDYLVADPFLRAVLRKVGFLKNGAGWSLLETRDYLGISAALRDVRIRDIFDVSEGLNVEGAKVPFERLVRNYIEFLGYASNNGLTPFFYNSESDFRRWGNLAERKNKRGERVVDLSLRSNRKTSKPLRPRAITRPIKLDLKMKLKRRLEIDALVGALRDPDPLIRQKSVESLGKLAEPDLFPHLVDRLNDDEPEVRQELVRAIFATQDPRAEEILLKVAERDEVLSVQLTAAYLLTKKGSLGVLSFLLDALAQRKPHFSTLLTFHPGLPTNPQALLRLSSLAVSEDPGVRKEVAFILGCAPPKVSKGILDRLIQDPDEHTRCNALYSLYFLKDKNVLGYARQLASHPSEETARSGTIVETWSKSKRK